MKYLIISTYNGEGYSSPILKTTTSREKAFEFKNDFIFEYPDDIEKLEYNDFDIILDDGKSQGRIQIIILPNTYNLLKVMPDVNDIQIIGHFDNLEDALVDLEVTVRNPECKFEEDDLADYSVNDKMFASHSDNQGYIHLEII